MLWVYSQETKNNICEDHLECWLHCDPSSGLIHAGTNIPDTFRLFDYLDNDKIEREANTRGVVLDSLMKSHYIRDSNPKPISALALLSKLDQ